MAVGKELGGAGAGVGEEVAKTSEEGGGGETLSHALKPASTMMTTYSETCVSLSSAAASCAVTGSLINMMKLVWS